PEHGSNPRETVDGYGQRNGSSGADTSEMMGRGEGRRVRRRPDGLLVPVGIVQAGDGARVDAGPRVERDAEVREDPGEQARDPRRSRGGGLRKGQRGGAAAAAR